MLCPFQERSVWPHHVKRLNAACECLDRAAEARQAIERIQDPVREIRPHPGVAVERDQKALLARFLRELNLDVDAPAEPYSRPPRLIGENQCHDLEEQLI